ncbi:hypothetical protein L1987_43888 [Smallanthus sonchifolius]|uniref:Uncharacterized protein n=1 Tax=Smallanthus sonchifolius TaxID=185202 RepID=A0ACB9GNM2_9ASTR|nr:hypothetical protein L1987_43888 [Smallanthus sonchifolius]
MNAIGRKLILSNNAIVRGFSKTAEHKRLVALKKLKIYTPQQRILVIGEKNFEFSEILTKLIGPTNLVLTTPYSLCGSVGGRNTESTTDNSEELTADQVEAETKGNMLGLVKPQNVSLNPRIRGEDYDRNFDMVIYVNPHLLDKHLNLKNQNEETIQKHKAMMDMFLNYDCDLIFPKYKGGEGQIFVKSSGPYSKWGLPDLAKENKMEYEEQQFLWGGRKLFSGKAFV